MSLFSRYPERGDTVRLISDVPAGVLSTPARVGSVGVVTATSGSRVEIEVDGGLAGTISVSARTHQCRVIGRGTGVERFRGRMRMRNAVRFAALILLALPLIQFAWRWWLAVGSFDGVVEYLPTAVVESVGDFVLSAFTDPIRAALTLLYGSAISWLAFGPKRGR